MKLQPLDYFDLYLLTYSHVSYVHPFPVPSTDPRFQGSMNKLIAAGLMSATRKLPTIRGAEQANRLIKGTSMHIDNEGLKSPPPGRVRAFSASGTEFLLLCQLKEMKFSGLHPDSAGHRLNVWGRQNLAALDYISDAGPDPSITETGSKFLESLVKNVNWRLPLLGGLSTQTAKRNPDAPFQTHPKTRPHLPPVPGGAELGPNPFEPETKAPKPEHEAESREFDPFGL